MTIRSNAHTHTTFCDGANTPEEMIKGAIALGFTDLGFSSHAPAPFDTGCPGLKNEAYYRNKIAELRQKYAGIISVSCGVETDYFAPIQNRKSYDYIIGSVHYLEGMQGERYSVDASPGQLHNVAEQLYDGDYLRMARAYYSLVVTNVKKNRPDIIGHFDLIAKFNGKGEFFKEDSLEYQEIALNALEEVCDECKAYGGIIEVNTGAISRGYRTIPYPNFFLLEYMAQNNVKMMINSDSHAVATINYYFQEALQLVQKAGYKSICILKQGKVTEIEIENLKR